MEMMGIHVMDVKNPSKNYPKAIIIGSIITVCILSLIHIFVAVDVALVEIRADRRAARNGPVHPDRSHRNPGRTLVKIVAHLAFVLPQETFAGIALSLIHIF